MKNTAIAILLSVTLAFAAFVGGYYLGQSTVPTNITLSGPTGDPLPSPSGTPAETTPPTTSPTAAPTAPTAPAGPLNINTATLEQLDTLPGIGPVLAGRIIAYRDEIGGFRSPEELLEVEGIGEKTFEKLKDLITV